MVDLLFLCIEARNFEIVNKMVNEDYANVLKRDPTLSAKIDSICKNVFGQGTAPVNPMQAMMANLFSGGKK